MDLTAAISGLQSAKVTSQVQLAVASKILKTQQLAGASVVKLIEAAGRGIDSAAGQTLQAGDELVAQATGLGSSVDTYA